MAENNFSVVYMGRIAEGEDIDSVKKRMCALFKKPEPIITRILKARRSIIKKGLDRKTAEKYLRVIEKTGAVCKIEPEMPAEKIESSEPETSTETRVVAIPLESKGEESYSPIPADEIKGAENALIITAEKPKAISYSEIKAIAAFKRNEQNGGDINFLIFTKNASQPFLCNMENIAYNDFPISSFPKKIASFRAFLHFICKENPSVILEETTFDLLSGSQPRTLDEDAVLKLSTELGKVVESGRAESYT